LGSTFARTTAVAVVREPARLYAILSLLHGAVGGRSPWHRTVTTAEE